ncbi:hypothetical protein ALC56_11913 [Trachymyrmex septentrionalis]|uniref:Uncharacterized protein n=1 Tax=Trachymyrmex septentrionalis TaxID=34720 RepID=A0A151JTL8_9HYME|nr:hypothetical protein ALC56_11913 [Trachymyrmex septentrionalis]
MNDITCVRPGEQGVVRNENGNAKRVRHANNVIVYGVEETKEINFKIIIVTFDQPLYIKAKNIVACAGQNSILGNIVVRLGEFIFLSSIVFMAESDLKDLLTKKGSQLIIYSYASNSVDKMLVGHAYARAVRAHLIVQLVFTKIMLKGILLTVIERETVTTILQHFQDDPPTASEINKHPILVEMSWKLEQELLRIENNEPTAKL